MNFENKSILILGATSSIARALADQLAQEKAKVYLAGRNIDETQRIADDLKVRYAADTAAFEFEALNFASHESLFETVTAKNGGLDGVILVFGELGDQKSAEENIADAKRIIDSNYTAAVSILTPIANAFQRRQDGFIVGISSVAGDRGRQSNYIYGSAKGAFSLFLAGLRNRLSKSNVHVLTVKPGFVDTKMTFGKQGMFLVADPNDVAKTIIQSIKKNRQIVYVPWFWQWIMLIIKLIPEQIFMRMKM